MISSDLHEQMIQHRFWMDFQSYWWFVLELHRDYIVTTTTPVTAGCRRPLLPWTLDNMALKFQMFPNGLSQCDCEQMNLNPDVVKVLSGWCCWKTILGAVC